MRIGFFHEVQKGGARRSTIEFGKHLAKHHTVDFYYTDTKRSKSEESSFSSSHFYKFTPRKWQGHDIKARVYKDTVELYKLYRLHQKVAADINQKKYDLVFVEPSQYTQAPFLLRFIKTKKMYYCQESLRMVYDPFVNSIDSVPQSRKLYETFVRHLRKQIDRGNMLFADELLANSSFSKQNLSIAYNRSSTVCYMGVDTNVFKPKRIKKDIDVLYVGAYDAVDGLSLFEKAIDKLKSKPTVKILTREKEWIETDKDLTNLYNRAKITVCISRNEPFGLIPLESMASGTPVIAINQGGYKESVIHNKTGLLVKNSPKDLAFAIEKLLRNTKERDKFSINSRSEMVENWTWKKRTVYLEALMKNILTK